MADLHGSTELYTNGLPLGHGPLGHFVMGRQALVTVSIRVSPGHSQRATQCVLQMGLGVLQLGAQAEPHKVKSWPRTGQSVMEGGNYMYCYVN